MWLRNSFTYQQCQKKLLDEEIRIKNARIRTLKDELLDANSSLRSHVSYLDILHLKSVSDRKNTIYLKRHSATQKKKLFRLCKDSASTTNLSVDDVIFNHSKWTLSDQEKRVLVKGLNDTSIIFVKPDKGNGMVILDRSDYNKKMDDILSDETTFESSTRTLSD